jgi:hypothetical protein
VQATSQPQPSRPSTIGSRTGSGGGSWGHCSRAGSAHYRAWCRAVGTDDKTGPTADRYTVLFHSPGQRRQRPGFAAHAYSFTPTGRNPVAARYTSHRESRPVGACDGFVASSFPGLRPSSLWNRAPSGLDAAGTATPASLPRPVKQFDWLSAHRPLAESFRVRRTRRRRRRVRRTRCKGTIDNEGRPAPLSLPNCGSCRTSRQGGRRSWRAFRGHPLARRNGRLNTRRLGGPCRRGGSGRRSRTSRRP